MVFHGRNPSSVKNVLKSKWILQPIFMEPRHKVINCYEEKIAYVTLIFFLALLRYLVFDIDYLALLYLMKWYKRFSQKRNLKTEDLESSKCRVYYTAPSAVVMKLMRVISQTFRSLSLGTGTKLVHDTFHSGFIETLVDQTMAIRQQLTFDQHYRAAVWSWANYFTLCDSVFSFVIGR